MAENLHTVTITGGEHDTYPRIRFTCTGNRESKCHHYPACDCESWERDDHEHPDVVHEQCWLQSWFDTEAVEPAPDTLADCDITPGMSGPIKAWFDQDGYVEWEFVEPEVSDR
ncbi:hypothetical protein ACWCW7_34425 [Nocardia tengchongensis]